MYDVKMIFWSMIGNVDCRFGNTENSELLRHSPLPTSLFHGRKSCSISLMASCPTNHKFGK